MDEESESKVEVPLNPTNNADPNFSIFQYENLVMIKQEIDDSESSNITQFGTNNPESKINLGKRNGPSNDGFVEEQPMEENSSSPSLDYASMPIDLKPNIPLLFIEEDKKSQICFGCQLQILSHEKSVECRNACGQCQHLHCLPFYEDSSEAICNDKGVVWNNGSVAWKCSECLLLDVCQNNDSVGNCNDSLTVTKSLSDVNVTDVSTASLESIGSICGNNLNISTTSKLVDLQTDSKIAIKFDAENSPHMNESISKYVGSVKRKIVESGRCFKKKTSSGKLNFNSLSTSSDNDPVLENTFPTDDNFILGLPQSFENETSHLEFEIVPLNSSTNDSFIKNSLPEEYPQDFDLDYSDVKVPFNETKNFQKFGLVDQSLELLFKGFPENRAFELGKGCSANLTNISSAKKKKSCAKTKLLPKDSSFSLVNGTSSLEPLEKNSHINYVMLSRGSRNGRPKLFDSLGFSYIIRTITSRQKTWQCVKCNGWQNCQAYIKESSNEYFRSCYKHCHPCNLEEYKVAKKKNLTLESSDADCIYLMPTSKRKKIEIANQNVDSQSNTEGKPVKTHCRKSNSVRLLTKTKKLLPGKKESLQKSISKPKRRCTYIEIKGETPEEVKLVDQILGYTYRLQKTTERTKVWQCCMADTGKKCKAIVKQIGLCFIRSRDKHIHKSSSKEVAATKEVCVKKKEQIIHNRKRNSLDIGKPTKRNRNKNVQTILKNKSTLKTETKNPIVKKGNGLQSPLDYSKHPSAVQGKEVGTQASKQKFPHLASLDKKNLFEMFLTISSVGLPHSFKLLRETAKGYFDKKKHSFFPHNKPPKVWIIQFMEKHPVLSQMLQEGSGIGSNNTITWSKLVKFYSDLEAFLKGMHGIDAKKFISLKNAGRIFNCDEIELVINNSARKVKPSKDECRRTMNVLCCVSGDGASINPLIINKGHCIPKYDSHQDVDGTYSHLCSHNGEVTKTVFNKWLIDHFHTAIDEMRTQKPVILFINGSRSYVSYETIEYGKNNGIIIYHIPSAPKFLQPLSVSLFQVLRRKYIKKFEETLHINSKQISKRGFPFVFMKAYKDTDISGLSKSGFMASGLCPYNPEEISKSKFALGDNDEDLEDSKELSLPKSNSTTKSGKAKKRVSVTPQKAASSSDPSKKDQLNIRNPVSKKGTSTSASKASSSSSSNSNKGGSPTQNKEGFRDGYIMALQNIENLFTAVVDPSVLDLYKQKYNAEADYPDTTFLVWRGLQQLKGIPELLPNS